MFDQLTLEVRIFNRLVSDLSLTSHIVDEEKRVAALRELLRKAIWFQDCYPDQSVFYEELRRACIDAI